MMRSLNILAIATLIGSATAAYSVKYETILVAEKLRKREVELKREKDAIAVLKAEWEMLNRPARLQALAPPEPGMQSLSARQIVHPADIPQRGPDKDPIAAALDGTLTGALPAPARANPPKVNAPVPRSTTPVTRATPVTPSPPARPNAASPPATQPLPRQAAGAPLMLRPPAEIGRTRASPTPRAEPLAAPVPRRNVPTPQR